MEFIDKKIYKYEICQFKTNIVKMSVQLSVFKNHDH